MKLATLRDHSRDGQLVAVSRDLRRAVRATHVAKTLLAALESWEDIAPALVASSGGSPAAASDPIR